MISPERFATQQSTSMWGSQSPRLTAIEHTIGAIKSTDDSGRLLPFVHSPRAINPNLGISRDGVDVDAQMTDPRSLEDSSLRIQVKWSPDAVISLFRYAPVGGRIWSSNPSGSNPTTSRIIGINSGPRRNPIGIATDIALGIMGNDIGQMSHLKPKEMVGDYFGEKFHPSVRQQMIQIFAQATKQGTLWQQNEGGILIANRVAIVHTGK